jgi:hypothetical protein
MFHGDAPLGVRIPASAKLASGLMPSRNVLARRVKVIVWVPKLAFICSATQILFNCEVH